MFFKRMDLYGFKSFAHKTSIEFNPGATVIVGPNGCGKSNILDAIRWVLGEQNARLIRGQRMGDVIFNGSASLKTMNLARVALTLGNEDRALDIDAEEVEIGRQLLRTGESNYQINRKACRVKSIHELLADTGVGVNAYSVIEQGRVDQIVMAKPVERRLIFEEAAGISRYKRRKVEALRKLERTEDDLARLSDIIREVKGRSISLKRQANKALRFRALDAELRQLEMALLSVSYRDEAERQGQARQQFDRLGGELERLNSALDELEGRLDEERERLEAVEAEEEGLLETLNRQREAIAQRERTVALLDERQGAYDRQSGQLAEEVQAAHEQAGKIEGQREELDRACVALDGEIEDVERERNERLEALQTLRRDLETRRGRLREDQKELDAEREVQRRRENEARLGVSRRETIEEQLAKAREQAAALAERRRELDNQLETIRSETERLERLIEERRRRLNDVLSRRARTEESLSQLLADLEVTVQAHSETTARLEALRELEQRYEGYGHGVRAVMRAVEEERLKGVRGVLGRLIRSHSDFETAIEMVLGSRIEDIVTATAEDAQRAIAFLRGEQQGRANFLPLNLIRPGEGRSWFPDVIRRAGVIDVAARLVEHEDWLAPVVRTVLGGTILVEDLDVALGLLTEGYEARYVSLDGEVVAPEGSVAGGHILPAGLLGREREIDELEERVSELSKREEELREAVFSHRETLRLGAETLNELRDEVHQHDVALARARNERDQLGQAIDDMDRRLEEQAGTETELEKDLGRTRERIETAQREASAIQAQADEIEERMEADQAAVEEMAETLNEASERLNESVVALTSARERRSSLRDRAAAAAGEVERVRRTAEQKAAQIETLREQIENAREEQQQAREALRALTVERDETQKRLTEQHERREKQSRLIEDHRQKIHALTRDRNEVQNRAHEADLRLQQATLKISQLDEQAREKFALSALEVAREVDALRRRIEERLAREAEGGEDDERVEEASERGGAGGEQSEGDEVGGETDADVEPAGEDDDLLLDLPEDPGELRERIRPLREQIARLGPINTVAIEEYEELRERYQFLQGQHDDMVEARDSLIKTIKTIDKTSRERFEQAFEQIDRNFQEVFRRLFNGGKAHLELDPEVEDVLEAGVEILAQPPGKNIGSLRQLSGGEKALTAIAVLFALFEYRPSPFCVLDEIDAPLDDANVVRLVEMLQEFSKQVQLIVITHNKITMQLADTIYGVTMQEPGVSRVLTVPRRLLKDPERPDAHVEEERRTGNGNGNGAGAEDHANESVLASSNVN